MTDLNELRHCNIERAKQVFPQSNEWSLMEKACELGGEAGEALNAAKKLQRDGETPERLRVLADELADVVICADLVAIKAGIDLAGALVRKFNQTSLKLASNVLLLEDSGSMEAFEAGMLPGAYVRYRHPNGSVGQLIEQVSCGRFKVRYYYGRDVRGVFMTSLDTVDWSRLVLIDRETFWAKADRKPS